MAIVRAASGDDRERLARVLDGVRRYQVAPRAAEPAVAPAIDRVGAVTLRDLGGDGPELVVVPSLINAPRVLDLPGRSLLTALRERGLRVLLIDWGRPAAGERRLGLDGLVALRLAPLLARRSTPPRMLGYCLGGTLALLAAARTPVERVATLATPWDFDGYPVEARAAAARHWSVVELASRPLGAVPVEMLQPLFWALDQPALVAKFERLATADAAALAGFVAVEDWANGGPPIGRPAVRDILVRLLGRGGLAGALPHVPLLQVVAARDRLVPVASIAATGQRIDVPLGHVGMVVGSRAPLEVWKPLGDWLTLPIRAATA